MLSSPLLSLPDGLAIDQVSVLYECVRVVVRSVEPSAICPLCSEPARRVHSRYLRTIVDVPCGGRQLVLSLQVRKFFCQTAGCPRRIFAERFPELVRPWGRMRLRFCSELESIGFATSGEAGARLAMQLGLPTSPSTILRRLKAVWVPASKGTTKVGIDDWAFRRGLSYGSILVDLETHRVIELLPDRTVATATRWFKEHPEIEVISRDRGQDYTTAASQGAPQAVQVADRWHIVHNLTEAVSLVLENYRTQLRRVSQLLVPAVEPEPQKEQASEGASSPLPVACGEPYRTPFIQRVQQARQRQRLQRYHQLVELQQQGMTQAQMAQRMGLSQRTIRRWLGQDHSPQKRQRQRRPSLIDPYETYVLTRWQQGCHNGLQIWREIAARGYSGSPKAVYSYLARLRPAAMPAAESSSSPAPSKRNKRASSSGPSDPFLTRRAVRLLLRRPSALTRLEQEALQRLCQLHPQVEALYQLIQGFMSMLYQHQAHLLDSWLAAVRCCGMAELERFGRGVEQDKAAIVAGLSLPYSNGVVEGHVNRLKLIKRMMYGRAEFPLLRQRVLHRA